MSLKPQLAVLRNRLVHPNVYTLCLHQLQFYLSMILQGLGAVQLLDAIVAIAERSGGVGRGVPGACFSCAVAVVSGDVTAFSVLVKSASSAQSCEEPEFRQK